MENYNGEVFTISSCGRGKVDEKRGELQPRVVALPQLILLISKLKDASIFQPLPSLNMRKGTYKGYKIFYGIQVNSAYWVLFKVHPP